MKKRLLVILILVFASQLIFSGSTSQWEYMVVSFGKANFSQLKSKTMAYWENGISKNAYGDSIYEKDLDILGQNGWEVVSILGAIGGDQQVMLKRPFDSKRTATEKRIIDTNSKLVIDGFLDVLLAAEEKNKETKPELINLDAYEKQQALMKARKEAEAVSTQYLNSMSVKPSNIKYVWDSKEEKLSITVDYDVTKQCLIGVNQYRSSKVKEHLLNFLSFTKFPLSKDQLSSISVDAYINYTDDLFYVGHLYFYYDYRDNLKLMDY